MGTSGRGGGGLQNMSMTQYYIHRNVIILLFRLVVNQWYMDSVV